MCKGLCGQGLFPNRMTHSRLSTPTSSNTQKIDITEAENKINKQCKSDLCFDGDECKLVIKYIEKRFHNSM